MNIFFLVPFLLVAFSAAGQVGIGNNKPNPGVLSDPKNVGKAGAPQHVELKRIDNPFPMSKPADGTVVFNNTSTGNGPNDLKRGYYYWNSTDGRWIPTERWEPVRHDVGFGPWSADQPNNNISEYHPTFPGAASLNRAFGAAVCLSGNTALIGAPGQTQTSSPNYGGVFVYTYNGRNWEQRYWIAPPERLTSSLTGFGSSITFSSSTAVVGAAFETRSYLHQGAVYIYNFNGTHWLFRQKLTIPSRGDGVLFGRTVCLSERFVFVGAPGDDENANASDRRKGAVYVFQFDGSSWVQMQKLVAPDGQPGQNFGESVAVLGDVAVVGAGGSGFQPGAVYLFTLRNGTWSQTQKLTPTDTRYCDAFGSSVSLSGNGLLVGAPGNAYTNPICQGSAYVFRQYSSGWIQEEKLVADEDEIGDGFGISVSLSGDRALVGAKGDDNGTVAAQGSAYLFQKINSIWQPYHKVVDPNGGTHHYFGTSAALDGRRFVVGAPGESDGKGLAVFGKVN